MPCNHQFLEQHLEAALDDRLDNTHREALHSCLADCEHCRTLYERAHELQSLAEAWDNRAVPAWNRRLFPFRPPREVSGWWHWSALATSVCALVLVLLNTRITLNDGIEISLGQAEMDEVQQVLAEQLALSRQLNQAQTRALLSAFNEQQAQQQAVYLNQILDRSREERRDDLLLLNAAWQNQRLADQQNMGMQVNQLATWQLENTQYMNTLARNASTNQR